MGNLTEADWRWVIERIIKSRAGKGLHYLKGAADRILAAIPNDKLELEETIDYIITAFATEELNSEPRGTA